MEVWRSSNRNDNGREMYVSLGGFPYSPDELTFPEGPVVPQKIYAVLNNAHELDDLDSGGMSPVLLTFNADNARKFYDRLVSQARLEGKENRERHGEDFYEEDPDNSYWGYEFKSILDEDVLDYDATAKTISGKNVITIDGAKDDIYYADLYDQPYLYVFQEVPACPADPDITYFYNYDEEYGYGLVDFGITTLDINGDYITPEKLSYTVYFDDEAFEFDPEEYMSLDEAITEIPYTFDDSYDITTYGSDKEISFYFSVAKNVGIQTIYRGGGEVHKSNIVFYDINENSFSVVDVEDPIRTGALSPVSTQRVASESYHDLTGRTVNASARGLIIKTVTFADGTRKSYKLVRR